MSELVYRQPCDQKACVDGLTPPAYHAVEDRWCLGYREVVLDPDKVLRVGSHAYGWCSVKVSEFLAALEKENSAVSNRLPNDS
jgi:hypothetical protein